MTYTVASGNFVVGEFGSQVTEEELGGVNIAAAIAAGHLVPNDAEDLDKSTANPANDTEEK
jgi:hypothetical protein